MVKWTEIKSKNREALESAAKNLNVHPLALEDAIHRDQRGKLEEYENHQLLVWFLMFKGIIYEIQFIIFADEILMVPHDDPPEGATWKEFLRLNPENAKSQLHLLYQALDSALDITWNEVQKLFDQIDAFEEHMFQVECDPLSLLDLKKQLNLVEHSIGNLPSVAQQIRSFYQVKDELRWKLRDLHDHCERIYRDIVFYRSQIISTIELYWGHQANRSNKQIKKLTLLASISVPLTFWASFWGMNFETIPFHSERLFYIALGIMVISVIGTLAFLIQRGYWSD